MRAHADRITATIQRYAPRHVIVILGGNDLDSADPQFDLDCFVFRLVTFLTQIRNQPSVQAVTILSLFGRERTRSVHPEVFNDRVCAANCLLREQCSLHGIHFWKLRGFTHSSRQLFRDGVHLNDHGLYKLLRRFGAFFCSIVN
jgi:lysophospholipase L1-like esterase